MLRDGLLVFYCAAIGFVAAGIASSFYKMVTSEPARFALLGPSWVGVVSTFFFFALTGPAIIMETALRRGPTERKPAGWLFASLLVAALWSMCSGIVVLELVISVQGSLA